MLTNDSVSFGQPCPEIQINVFADNSMMSFDHSPEMHNILAFNRPQLCEVYLLLVNVELEYLFLAFIDLRMNL